jgi:O-antigen/teichoic acid export membrane protein
MALGALTFSRAVGVFALAQFGGMVAMLVILLREFRRPAPADAGVPIRDIISEAGIVEEDPGAVPGDLAERSLAGLIAYNLRRGWLGQISAVAYFLLLRLDQGLLEYYRGAVEVGIYSIAVYAGEMLWLLPGALTPLLVHSSAGHATDPDRDRTAARAVRLGLLLTLAAALPLFFLAEPLLAWAAGGAYRDSGQALRALLPGIVAFAPGVVLAGDFIGRGKPHWNTQASALTVVVNVVAGVLLIPGHGPVGAAWASSIAYTCGSAVMLIRFRQITRLSLRGLIHGRS